MDRLQRWAVERGCACSLTWRKNGEGCKLIGILRVRFRSVVCTNSQGIATNGGIPPRLKVGGVPRKCGVSRIPPERSPSDVMAG
jgi:hypothetical protein